MKSNMFKASDCLMKQPIKMGCANVSDEHKTLNGITPNVQTLTVRGASLILIESIEKVRRVLRIHKTPVVGLK